MKPIPAIVMIAVIGFIACERKPYVEHKLKFEKVSDDCAEQQSYFRMLSNFGGERYEFEKCLPADFTREQLVSERRGDTILISFKNETGPGGKVYHLTLDIDSYPRYNYLTVGEEIYSITSTENK